MVLKKRIFFELRCVLAESMNFPYISRHDILAFLGMNGINKWFSLRWAIFYVKFEFSLC